MYILSFYDLWALKPLGFFSKWSKPRMVEDLAALNIPSWYLEAPPRWEEVFGFNFPRHLSALDQRMNILEFNSRPNLWKMVEPWMASSSCEPCWGAEDRSRSARCGVSFGFHSASWSRNVQILKKMFDELELASLFQVLSYQRHFSFVTSCPDGDPAGEDRNIDGQSTGKAAREAPAVRVERMELSIRVYLLLVRWWPSVFARMCLLLMSSLLVQHPHNVLIRIFMKHVFFFFF